MMKDLFKGYQILSNNDHKSLWHDAIFIFDTSALLNLYQFPDEARDVVFSITGKLGSRLWIPYHAALEFNRNRASIRNKQKKLYNTVINSTRSTIDEAINELRKYNLKERHSVIDPESFIEELEFSVKKFISKLIELDNAHPSASDADPVYERISMIFDKKIGMPPSSQEEIKKIEKEMDDRYAISLPPGYMDKAKSGVFSYGGIIYSLKAGDLIFWKQIIAHAKKENIKKIVIVSDDKKDDWIYFIHDKENSYKKEIISPRPELIDEIQREASVELFHIYSSTDFLENAKIYFGADVSNETVEQVKDITDISNNTKVWKIGSRWDDYGAKEASILDIFLKYKIVFAGKYTEKIEANVSIGDYIAISDGLKIVAVGKVLDKPKEITEYDILPEDYEERFHYEDWVIGFKVDIQALSKSEYMDYGRMGTFHALHGGVKRQVVDLYNQKKYNDQGV